MTPSVIPSVSATNSGWREKRGQEKLGDRRLELIVGYVSPSTQGILISGPVFSNSQA